MDPLVHGISFRQMDWDQMLTHIIANLPEEACGLVAGKNGVATKIYPVPNALQSEVRFRMDPQAQVLAFLEIEKMGWELEAIYHSHPQGPPVPSQTDIAEAAYPDAAYLIWSPLGERWDCRAFLIQRQEVKEILISVTSE